MSPYFGVCPRIFGDVSPYFVLELMIPEKIREKLILSLDFHDPQTALSWVEQTGEWIGMFKVGSQLFTQAGPNIVKEIIQRGGKVFLDLKFHDIPNTVAACGQAAVDMGVSIFNVHASGGKEMMQTCARAVAKRAQEKDMSRPLVLAVTVLTSLDDQVLQSEVGIGRNAQAQVSHLAKMAFEAGLDGVVASGREIKSIRATCPSPFKILTPGIRSQDDPPDDQKRTITAAEAFHAGADYIVLGRTVTSKPDSARILKSLHAVLLKTL